MTGTVYKKSPKVTLTSSRKLEMSHKLVSAFLLLIVAACASPPGPPSSIQTPAPDEPSRSLSESATSDLGPTPESRVMASQIYDDFFGAAVASLEERIYLSDIVVLARLLSAEGDVLRFRAVEYLKGTGASEFTVRASTVGRDTQYDDRDAVLFLVVSDGQARSGGGTPPSAFDFADSTTFDYAPDSYGPTRYAGNRPVGYTFGTRNPVWLPVEPGTSRSSTAKTTGSSSRTSTNLITDSGSPVSLSDLRSKIAWIEGGAGIPGYDLCIRGSVAYIRKHRDWEAYHGTPWELQELMVEIVSGAAKGTDITDSGTYGSVRYSRDWITGQDADLFAAKLIDDDADPTNGFRTTVVTARPLPSGNYRVIDHVQSPGYIPCNFVPEHNRVEHAVTVTPPIGSMVVHEAFFDPVAVGAAVGADGANGVLKPAAFTVGGASATITSLKWESGTVTMELNPSASLAGHAIDLIALDGSVTLTLSFDDATQSGGALTWSVANQPWQAGDLLILRIGRGE